MITLISNVRYFRYIDPQYKQISESDLKLINKKKLSWDDLLEIYDNMINTNPRMDKIITDTTRRFHFNSKKPASLRTVIPGSLGQKTEVGNEYPHSHLVYIRFDFVVDPAMEITFKNIDLYIKLEFVHIKVEKQDNQIRLDNQENSKKLDKRDKQDGQEKNDKQRLEKGQKERCKKLERKQKKPKQVLYYNRRLLKVTHDEAVSVLKHVNEIRLEKNLE
jgi:hypothetical protein